MFDTDLENYTFKYPTSTTNTHFTQIWVNSLMVLKQLPISLSDIEYYLVMNE